MSDYFMYRERLGPVIDALSVTGCEGDEHVAALFRVGLQGLGGGYSGDAVFHETILKQACFEVLTNLVSIAEHQDDEDWNEAIDTVVARLQRLKVEL